MNSTDLNDYSPCKNKRSKIHIIRVTVLFSLGEEYIVLAKKDIQEDKKNKDFDLHKNHILKLKKDDTYAIYYISEHKKKKVSDKSKRK